MNTQLLIIIILLVVVAGIGFWWFTSVLPGGSDTPAVIDADLETRLVSYRRLESVELDMSAFQDEFFRELVSIPDLLTPLVPEGQVLGRPNPYAAAVGGASSAPASGQTLR
ncbi:MAG: hypothetical protein HYT98_01560 [Candidatus Sungbacteria bacterium]|nr:hypothetical protein [Candidatus Sungbacteria bacterium]